MKTTIVFNKVQHSYVKLIIFFFFLCCINQTGIAQSVSGQILTANSLPAENAQLLIGKHLAKVDNKGMFTCNHIESGFYTVHIIYNDVNYSYDDFYINNNMKGIEFKLTHTITVDNDYQYGIISKFDAESFVEEIVELLEEVSIPEPNPEPDPEPLEEAEVVEELSEEEIEELLEEEFDGEISSDYVRASSSDEGDGNQGSGTRNYDDSGNSVFGRRITKQNWRELFKGGDQSKGSGKVTVKYCVDRQGQVGFAEILFDETTETDRDILKRAVHAAYGYEVQADPNAPAVECGKLVFNLNINSINNSWDKPMVKTSDGTGNYDDSGNGVFGRKITKRNWRELFEGGANSKSAGKITTKFCVDRHGKVNYAEIIHDETTETDNDKLKRAVQAAYGYEVQAKPDAPAEQCGKLIFNLEINALGGGQ